MKIALIAAAFVAITGFYFWNDINSLVAGKSTETEKKEKKKKDKESEVYADPGVDIREKWDLPSKLLEVSGIAYLEEGRMATVQDEEGTIFIYNMQTKNIEKEIPFAGPGDYEGITVNGKTAYVVRADGHLYEINLDAGKGAVKEYNTPLTLQHNVEGLCYDGKNNRLLLAIKGNEPGTKEYKGVYGFDLATKKMNTEPVYKIDLTNEVLGMSSGKKKKTFMPSAIGIHPVNGDIMITDGTSSKLLVMDQQGQIKRLVELGRDFAQPEGITFSPEGEVFISNEGTKQPGNIMKVELK